MKDKMPESVIAAAIAKLEAEKQSRIVEKIAKGEAVRVPPNRGRVSRFSECREGAQDCRTAGGRRDARDNFWV